jgi:hypothetical protein
MAEALIVILPLIFWWALPTYLTHDMGSRAGRRYQWLWGFFLGWIGVLIVWALTRAERQRIRREEERREEESLEEETGEDAETRKLRRHGLG